MVRRRMKRRRRKRKSKGKRKREKKKGKETEGASGNKTNVNMIQDTMIKNTTMFFVHEIVIFPKPAMSSTDPTIRLWNPIMSLFGILSSNSLDLAQVSTFASR
jgi:hypothetical protein